MSDAVAESQGRTPASVLSRLAGIDTRSLALLRVSLAALVLVDLALRARELVAFYTDAGVLPTWAVVEWLGVQSRLVAHAWGGSATYQALLFAITGIAALGMLLGYRTRLATAVTWFLVASLQARNPTLNNGGDHLLRIMLFWSMFVPLGARWSIDRARLSEPPPVRVVTGGSFAIQMQLCLMYWFTAVLKWHPVWFESYTATEIALSVDYLATSWGRVLLGHPELLQGLTAFTIWLEIIGPILVWSPVWTGPLRFATVLAFVAFHLVGLAPALHIGLFPWVCAAAWLVFLPTWMWERLERGRPALSERAAAPFTRLARRLGGRRTAPRLSAEARRRWSLVESVVATALLVFVVVWNFWTLDEERDEGSVPTAIEAAARFSGLGQRWAMFAPHPPMDDGWWVMPGRTASGAEIDVWRGAPLAWAKPLDVARTYPSKRWNKYLANLSRERYLYHRPLFGEYVCRSWNGEHPDSERLLEFQMIFLLERFDTPGAAPEPLGLWAQRCEPDA